MPTFRMLFLVLAVLAFGAPPASAEGGGDQKPAQNGPPKKPADDRPKPVTCKKKGWAPDSSCTRTDQRRRLVCTDGTERRGMCREDE